MTAPRQIAVVRSYDELIEALRARALELNATHDAIDEVAGLPTRYTAKALALGMRRKKGSPLSAQAMWPMMTALGIGMLMIEDSDAMARYASRLGTGHRSYMLNGAENAPVILKFSRRKLKKMGRMSAAARMKKISPSKRRRIARNAAKARWRKPKIVEIIDNAESSPSLAGKPSRKG